MGNQSFNASGALDTLEMRNRGTTGQAMSGVLSLRDGASNNYATFSEDFKDRSGAHVEDSLIQRLKTHYNGHLSAVPNQSRLIFFSNYSPCSQCTGTTIPQFMTDLAAVGRAIQVKFLFRTYYSVEAYNEGNSHLRYQTNQDAANAYNVLMTQYRGPTVHLKRTSNELIVNTYQTPTAYQRTTEYKEIRPLVIAQNAAPKAPRYTQTAIQSDLSSGPTFATMNA